MTYEGSLHFNVTAINRLLKCLTLVTLLPVVW